MNEDLVLAAILESRSAYEQAVSLDLLKANCLSESASVLAELAARQYQLDPALQKADRALLRSAVESRYKARGVATNIVDYMRSLPSDVSSVNVMAEAQRIRQHEIGQELATRLASGRHDAETGELIERYQAVSETTVEGDLRKWRLEAEDFGGTSGQRIPLVPKILNSKLNGGVLRGHNIVVYARPEIGKSLFALNFAAYSVATGKRVLYVANEEPDKDITRRLLARLTGTDINNLHSEQAIAEAIDKCRSRYENFHLLHEAGCTARDVSKAALQTEPDIIIVDQLKNLKVDDDNRALQLDRVAREIRQLGIKHNAVTLSVTQAGATAQNKRILDMNDVEFSHTGIPGAADLMIGIGADENDLAINRRTITLNKNKVSGVHASFPVWVDPTITAFTSGRK